MKTRRNIYLLSIGLALSQVHAASSIQLEVGAFKNSNGISVTTGTWVLILDSNDDNQLPGDLAAGPANNGSLNLSNITAINEDFTGKTLGLNNAIGNDTIVAIGEIGDIDLGADYVAATVTFNDGQEGLAYGIYWFPGKSPGNTLTGDYEIGGYFQSDTTEFAAYGMFAPPPLTAQEPAAFDVSGFNAIIIPEPSALVLTLLGSAALLRRRRA